MPLFEYHCPTCDAVFEEMGKADDAPACPSCAHAPCERLLTAPNLKTGAAPFKVGPVRPMAPRSAGGACPHSSGGGCGGCGQSTTLG